MLVFSTKQSCADTSTTLQGKKEDGAEGAAAATTDAAADEVQPLQDITNVTNNTDPDGKAKQARAPRERRERGPPADGIPSKTKVMVANLPYDLTEEKVGSRHTLVSPHADTH